MQRQIRFIVCQAVVRRLSDGVISYDAAMTDATIIGAAAVTAATGTAAACGSTTTGHAILKLQLATAAVGSFFAIVAGNAIAGDRYWQRRKIGGKAGMQLAVAAIRCGIAALYCAITAVAIVG